MVAKQDMVVAIDGIMVARVENNGCNAGDARCVGWDNGCYGKNKLVSLHGIMVAMVG